MNDLSRPSAPNELQPVTDVDLVFNEIGDVIEDGNRRVAGGWPVRSVVPGSHDAYVRILHPAWESSASARRMRWSEIAAGAGARLEGTVPFRRITVPPGADVPKGPQGAWDEDAMPMMGTLPEPETNVLLDLIGPSLDCWFVQWDGWEGLRLDPRQVSVGWQGNPHLVARGPIEVVRFSDWNRRWQTPHLWFAHDRAWCVGTEIEGLETYVAGSTALIERIISDPSLETLRVEPDDQAIISGDWLETR